MAFHTGAKRPATSNVQEALRRGPPGNRHRLTDSIPSS